MILQEIKFIQKQMLTFIAFIFDVQINGEVRNELWAR
jgi:hypothetical protein